MPRSHPRRRASTNALPGILAVLAGATGCADSLTAPEDLPEVLAAQMDPGPQWEEVERPGFSFLLPPGFEKLPLTPIDSDAASYERGTAFLMYDHGWYSPRPRAPEGAEDVTRAETRIGGRVATLLAYRLGGARVVEAFWARVGGGGQQRVDLFMRADAEDTDDLKELVATIHSVRFP